jgi:predicted AAA+ superfamily ATPase
LEDRGRFPRAESTTSVRGIEVKAKPRVNPCDYKGILALEEELRLERRVVVCEEARRRRDDRGVAVLPLAAFLKDLWAGKLV